MAQTQRSPGAAAPAGSSRHASQSSHWTHRTVSTTTLGRFRGAVSGAGARACFFGAGVCGFGAVSGAGARACFFGAGVCGFVVFFFDGGVCGGADFFLGAAFRGAAAAAAVFGVGIFGSGSAVRRGLVRRQASAMGSRAQVQRFDAYALAETPTGSLCHAPQSSQAIQSISGTSFSTARSFDARDAREDGPICSLMRSGNWVCFCALSRAPRPAHALSQRLDWRDTGEAFS
jgi:hypothetical protein